MVTINYKFADGHYKEIEVTDEFAEEYAKIESKERSINRKETRRHQSLDKSMEHGFDIANPHADVLEEVARRELSTQMKTALQTLTDRQSLIVIFYAFDKLSFQEIGKHLGIHKDTAREHYLSAIKKLKNFFQSTPSN